MKRHRPGPHDDIIYNHQNYIYTTHTTWLWRLGHALCSGWPNWAMARVQCSVGNSSSTAITSTGVSFLVICILYLLIAFRIYLIFQ